MMNDGNQIRRRTTTTATLTQPINGYSSAASSSNIGDGARGGGPVKQPQREQSILTTAALWLLGYIVIMAVMYKLGGSSNSVDIGSSGSSIGSIRMEMESWWSYVIQTKDLKSTPDEAMTRATKSSRNPLVRLLSGATFSPLVQRRKRQKPQDTPEQVANSATSRTSSTSSSSHLESADKDKVPKEKSIVAVEIEPTTPPLLPDKAVLPTTHYAFSEAYSVPAHDVSFDQLLTLSQLSRRVDAAIANLHRRVQAVAWGGSRHGSAVWWPIRNNNDNLHIQMNEKRKRALTLDKIDGGALLWHHYKVMRRHMHDESDLERGVYYPVKLCKQIGASASATTTSMGCSAEQSLVHTLQWRETYQPWHVSPSMREENENGWVYHRGFSPSTPPSPPLSTMLSSDKRNDKHSASSSYGQHALLWIRPGQHVVKDGLAYFRCILNAADRAIASALHESHGRVGKFNVVFDATDYEWSKLPSFAHTKQAIVMLQDHYPNRLGMILITNMSRSAEFFVSLILPLVSKEVRDKIHILSSDPERRATELASIVRPEFVPEWLGGPDRRKIDADYYYAQEHFSWTDSESVDFLKTMPYHALS